MLEVKISEVNIEFDVKLLKLGNRFNFPVYNIKLFYGRLFFRKYLY